MLWRLRPISLRGKSTSNLVMPILVMTKRGKEAQSLKWFSNITRKIGMIFFEDSNKNALTKILNPNPTLPFDLSACTYPDSFRRGAR